MSTDAFITELDSKDSAVFRKAHALFEPIRKDHEKVGEVVNAFRSKVDGLIDKQRTEYILAYENHMQDVQKELHNLREKVAEIANDETKNEKTNELKANQLKFKSEAIQLEADSDDLRKRMRVLVRKIYTVEKSRDWMLKKLRQAKSNYTVLLKERCRLYEEFDGSQFSQTSMSNASSYTLELKHSKMLKNKHTYNKADHFANSESSVRTNDKERTTALQNRVQNDYGVNRYGGGVTLPSIHQNRPMSPLIAPWDNVQINKEEAVPVRKQRGGPLRASTHVENLLGFHNPAALMAVTTGGLNGYSAEQNNEMNVDSSSGVPRTLAQQISTQNFGQNNTVKHPMLRHGSVPVFTGIHHVQVQPETHNSAEVEAAARGELIAARARKQEIRDFVNLCANSLHKGPWCRVKKRPLSKLVDACQLQLTSPQTFANNNEVLQLVCELAAYPETYAAILEVVNRPARRNNLDENYDYFAEGNNDEHQLSEYVDEEEGDAADDEYVPLEDDFDDRHGELNNDSSNHHADNSNMSNLANSFKAKMDMIVNNRDQQQQSSSKFDDSCFDEDKPQSHSTRHNNNISYGQSNTCVVDSDLLEYLQRERHEKYLRDSGYYIKDNFLDF